MHFIASTEGLVGEGGDVLRLRRVQASRDENLERDYKLASTYCNYPGTFHLGP